MKKEKILVVDDDKNVLLLVRVNLELEGYEILEALDGEEALKVVREEEPDLILLDIMMPKIDGWEVLERLTKESKTSRIPVVMLTAKTQESDQIKGWEKGVVDYITKPFNPVSLAEVVREALKRIPKYSSGASREAQVKKLEFIRRRREEKNKG